MSARSIVTNFQFFLFAIDDANTYFQPFQTDAWLKTFRLTKKNLNTFYTTYNFSLVMMKCTYSKSQSHSMCAKLCLSIYLVSHFISFNQFCFKDDDIHKKYIFFTFLKKKNVSFFTPIAILLNPHVPAWFLAREFLIFN